MGKYYVQCGPIRNVMTGGSADHAAMSALDTMLQQHIWIYDDPGLSEPDRLTHLMLEALLHLEPVATVSERGFGGADSVSVGVPETIQQWHQLMVGMNRLFVAAGLAPRPMSAVAGVVGPVCQAPRLPR